MSDTKNVTELQAAFNDLQEYSDNQFRTILDLKKQIDALKIEKKQLQESLEKNIPVISNNISNISIGITNEQLVCETQILLLKDHAVTRELTLEETKKFEIYTKVLENIKSKAPKQSDAHVEKMTDDQLLKLVVDNEQEA